MFCAKFYLQYFVNKLYEVFTYLTKNAYYAIGGSNFFGGDGKIVLYQAPFVITKSRVSMSVKTSLHNITLFFHYINNFHYSIIIFSLISPPFQDFGPQRPNFVLLCMFSEHPKMCNSYEIPPSQ